MFEEQKYLNSIDQLLELADRVMDAFCRSGAQPNAHSYSSLAELTSSSSELSLLIFGRESAFYKSCEKFGSYREDHVGPRLKGVLAGMKKSIEEGYMKGIRSQIFEEFSGDYLEMATNLNERDGLHIAAAVIAGTTLEERVRQLAKLHLGSDSKANGDPDSLENLNVKLREFYSGKISDQRLVTMEYGKRTQAAHGEWNTDKDDPRTKQIHKDLVTLMINSVGDFIRRNPA